jgi:hypothetical protein
MMQEEMESEGHATPIHVAGVNEPGSEGGNDAFTVGLGLPWLQDTAAAMAGASWGAEHFDLVIVDQDNVAVAVYSLIEYDLSDPADYNEIKRALAAVADRPPGVSSMIANARHGAAGGDMGSGAAGMHDHAAHGGAGMHGGGEREDMHRDMGEDGVMHGSEPCPVDPGHSHP